MLKCSNRFRKSYLTPNQNFNDEDELKNMYNATIVSISAGRLLSTIACIFKMNILNQRINNDNSV